MYLFLFNPQSKRGNKLKGKIKKYLSDLKLSGEFIEVKSKYDHADIVKEAIERKVERIVAIGGDGMINKLIPLLVKTDIVLSAIPVGETNFFANILGINDWRDGCNALIKGKEMEMNLGKIGDQFFISSVEVDSKEETGKKRFIFLKGSKKKKFTPVSINIVSDNTSLKLQADASSILISTIPVPPPPGFDIEESMEKQTLNIIVKNKPEDEKGSKRRKSEATTLLEGKQINIQSKSPMQVKVDGETAGKTPVEVEIASNCLRVLKYKK